MFSVNNAPQLPVIAELIQSSNNSVRPQYATNDNADIKVEFKINITHLSEQFQTAFFIILIISTLLALIPIALMKTIVKHITISFVCRSKGRPSHGRFGRRFTRIFETARESARSSISSARRCRRFRTASPRPKLRRESSRRCRASPRGASRPNCQRVPRRRRDTWCRTSGKRHRRGSKRRAHTNFAR